jgi:hypothetical protein
MKTLNKNGRRPPKKIEDDLKKNGRLPLKRRKTT